MTPQLQDEALHHVREGRGLIGPYREMRLPEALRVPRWLSTVLSGTIATGLLTGFASRRGSFARRLLRATFFGSAAAYVVTATLDQAEHFRMEKEVTGHYLRWVVIPPSETAVHAGIIGTNLSALLLARPLQRPLGLRDLWLLVAPGVFLTLGWIDEIGYHRRRAPHREDIIHTTQHLAEGIMWAGLYITRVARWLR